MWASAAIEFNPSIPERCEFHRIAGRLMRSHKSLHATNLRGRRSDVARVVIRTTALAWKEGRGPGIFEHAVAHRY
jgi:hypothetical protein